MVVIPPSIDPAEFEAIVKLVANLPHRGGHAQGPRAVAERELRERSRDSSWKSSIGSTLGAFPLWPGETAFGRPRNRSARFR